MAIMFEKRQIQRQQLGYYLRVYNRHKDQPIGHLGNVSAEGLMIISAWPMLVGGCFELRLKLPGREGGVQPLDFTALCRWSHEDVTPGTHDSGFLLLAPPPAWQELGDSLRRYFTFIHPVTSA